MNPCVYVCFCVNVCVCVYVTVCVYLYLCVCVYLTICVYLCVSDYVCVSMYLCVFVCMCVFVCSWVWCRQRWGWWRGGATGWACSGLLRSSKASPLLMSPEGGRNRKLTQDGAVTDSVTDSQKKKTDV